MRTRRSLKLLIIVGWWACLGGAPARAADEAQPKSDRFYEGKATWHDTLLASREALSRHEDQAPSRGKAVDLPDFGRSDYTVAAWIRTRKGGVVWSMSSAKGVWAERGGKVLFVRGGKLGFDACFIKVVTGRTHVADGQWHHVAMTYDADGRVAFYVDGKPDGGGNVRADADAPGHVVRIGMAARTFWPPNGFVGAIDEVRIFKRVLSPAEIRACGKADADTRFDGCVLRAALDALSDKGADDSVSVQAGKLVRGQYGKALRLDGKGSATVRTDQTGWLLREQLVRRVRSEFADAASQREMAWELADEIWRLDWPLGDRKQLALRYAAAAKRVPALQAKARRLAGQVTGEKSLARVRDIYILSRRADLARTRLERLDIEALSLATKDLIETFGDGYRKGKQYLARFEQARAGFDRLVADVGSGDPKAVDEAMALADLAGEAMLANPLLDVDRLLLIQRGEAKLGLTNNWNSNSSIAKTGYDNEIAVLSPVGPAGKLTTLYRPDGTGSKFVGDVDLHFDGGRMLFSMPGKHGRWQVFEIGADGAGLRQLHLIDEPDVDNYDACYLPDDNIIFCSTAPFIGVPCVTGSSHVCHLYRWQCDSGRIRRLTFEQDHDWCPTVLNNGRVMYLRWEYSDIPHFVSRILFHMNPDGTEQMEYYGSNSYWPNSMFYARPVPNHPTAFAAIVGGHHDVPRMGELVLFDPAQGRQEADGAVQRIPERDKPVKPILVDGLVRGSWPKFLHPYPLSEKYLIVSAKPAPQSRWGVYLVDTFDNMTLIKEVPGYALLEPLPLRATPRPPVIADKVDLGRKDALVYMVDVYEGPGLDGVPRGTVKQLRLFTYHFAYHGMGGQVNRVGLDGPWDIKRIIGTVPVEADGSALFRVPANTPIAVQPLDAEGKAVQLMRSWMTAMPGETLSCVGCHERQNSVPPTTATLATRRGPSVIEPWYGPTRGFSFRREVQPVLDRYCIGCHDGSKRPDERTLIDLRSRPPVHPPAPSKAYRNGTTFTPSYLELRRFVRVPTIESDMHLLPPYEFHADTSELVQMLRLGHHGVRLDEASWDRLITWIDLHAPAHGTWHEIVGEKKTFRQRDRRREMLKRYAGIDEDPEAIPESDRGPIEPVAPKQIAKQDEPPLDCPGWPFDAAEAKRRQQAGGPHERTIDLGGGVTITLLRVPAGFYVIGGGPGPGALPPGKVAIERPYWMSRCEVTNEQFACFDPTHDSRLEHGDFLQFSVEERGYPLNGSRQPVVRVSWRRAKAFCAWLGERTGERADLPTEAEWEVACRAGSAEAMGYGPVATDFAGCANLADADYRRVDTFDPWKLPSGAIHPYRPAIVGVKDGHKVSAPVGSFRPNPWGFRDMHGNAAEWTSGEFDLKAYGAARAEGAPPGARRTVRGGSWADRPSRATASSRWGYYPWQRVVDVGFRIVIRPEPKRVAGAASK